MHVCAVPNCPTLIPRAGRCTEHAREKDRARGSRATRGYGREHLALRVQWADRVARGTVNCWRCGNRIDPNGPWHLGHDDHDRSITKGPEHVACNLSAAGRASHRHDCTYELAVRWLGGGYNHLGPIAWAPRWRHEETRRTSSVDQRGSSWLI